MTDNAYDWKTVGNLFKKEWREKDIRFNAERFDNWWRTRKEYPLMFDSLLYLRCFNIHEQLTTKNQDHLLVISGGTGTGKSHLGGQILKTVCPTATLKDYVYSYEDFMRKVNELIERKIKEHEFKKEYETEHGTPPSTEIILQKFPLRAIIFDEAIQNLSSKDAMTKQSRQIEQALMQIRAVNVFIILCIPSFFSLNRYTREERTYTLIQCNGQQNPFTYTAYIKNSNEEADNIRAIAIKKKFNAAPTKSDKWYGQWFNYYPSDLNWNDYEVHKLRNIKQNVAGYVMKSEPGIYMTTGEAAKHLGVSNDTTTKLFDKGKLEGHKVGKMRKIKAESVLNYKKMTKNVVIH